MKIILCDDDPLTTRDIRRRIQSRYKEAEIVECKSGQELLSLLDFGDIIFLDVEMPELDGMETARRIRLRDKEVSIIFLTGFTDKVFEAFEVEAFRYLVKPVSDSDIFTAISKALERKEREKYLSIEIHGRRLEIPFSKIIYAEVFNRIIRLHTKTGKIDYYGKLTDLENELGQGFFRCHRSFLVNMSYVKSYDANDVLLLDDIKVPLSRKKYSSFIRAYIASIKGEPE